MIQEEAGSEITLIDSGQETAKVVKNLLENMNIDETSHSGGTFQCFVSDIPDKFDEVGTRFLGKPVVNAERVDFDSFLIEKGEKIYSPLNLYEKNG